MRATISEVARAAGVSTATVDRVLNERAGVRARTRDRVLEAAARLGYFGLGPEAEVRPRMDFILPAGPNSFMQSLSAHIFDAATRRGNIDVRMHEVEARNPARLSERLRELRGRTDAVGLVALDHPQIREDLDILARSGVRIGTLVSDLPSVMKVGYVGIDNRAAGRLAGMLMGRFLPGDGPREVVVCIGSHAYRGHEEREMGFRAILSEDFPEIRIGSFIEIGDDRDRAHAQVGRILADRPIGGIYNIGSGNQGIARALRDAGMARRTIFIGHDLTDATQMMLLERTMDAVIDQNPRVEAREIVRLLTSAIRGSDEPEYLPRLQVVFRENIPAS